MVCSKCGKEINKEDKFCPKCGTKVLNTEKTKIDISQNIKKEKFPFEIVLFAGIVFFILPALTLLTNSSFLRYELFGKLSEILIPFSVSYYIAWLVVRRVFQNKNVNKWVLKIIIFISAILITSVAFYPEIFN